MGRGGGRGRRGGRGRGRGRSGGRGRGGGRGGRGGDRSRDDFIKMDGVMNVTTESDVGITAVLGVNGTVLESLPPDQCFTGVIKHRYTDFQVREVDLSGVTLKIKDLPVPTDTGNKKRRKQEYIGYSGIANLSKEYMERSTGTWRQYLCGTFGPASTSISTSTSATSSSSSSSTSTSTSTSTSSSSSTATATATATTATIADSTDVAMPSTSDPTPAIIVPNFKRSRVPLPDQKKTLELHTMGERSAFVRSTMFTRHLIGKDPVVKPPPTLTEDTESALVEIGEALESETTAATLRSMCLHGIDQKSGDTVFCLPATEDRDFRRTIHLLLKRLPRTIIADTVADPKGTEGKSIRIRVNSRKQKGGTKRGRDDASNGSEERSRHGKFDTRGSQETWPEGQPDYIKFLLYKENMDTQSAIGSLCRTVGCKPKVFSYAGTKDKRAVTCQAVTAYRVLPNHILRVNRSNFKGNQSSNIAVSNVEFVDKPLRLGQLQGNSFSIVLRDATTLSSSSSSSSSSSTTTTTTSTKQELVDVLSSAVSTLKESGFINYFGLQRFGTGASPTHVVGRALLQKNFDRAVELILSSRLGSHTPKFPLEQKDVDTLFPKIARWMNPEFDVLNVLRNGSVRSSTNALDAVPRTMRMLYVHAYQSFVWNTMTSKRLTTHGLSVVVGDLIVVEKEVEDDDQMKKEDDQMKKEDDQMDVEMEDKEKKEDRRGLPDVHIVTQEDVDANKYSVYEVVLPLPGVASVYPTNMIEFYKAMLQEDGTHELFFGSGGDASSKVGGGGGGGYNVYHLEGGYRTMLKKVDDAEGEVLDYYLEDQQIQPTDRDFMDETFALYQGTEGSISKQAVQMRFTLPSSSYATMCMRQLFGGLTSTVAGGGGAKKDQSQ